MPKAWFHRLHTESRIRKETVLRLATLPRSVVRLGRFCEAERTSVFSNDGLSNYYTPRRLKLHERGAVVAVRAAYSDALRGRLGLCTLPLDNHEGVGGSAHGSTDAFSSA